MDHDHGVARTRVVIMERPVLRLQSPGDVFLGKGLHGRFPIMRGRAGPRHLRARLPDRAAVFLGGGGAMVATLGPQVKAAPSLYSRIMGIREPAHEARSNSSLVTTPR